jgi:hypothetical protein
VLSKILLVLPRELDTGRVLIEHAHELHCLELLLDFFSRVYSPLKSKQRSMSGQLSFYAKATLKLDETRRREEFGLALLAFLRLGCLFHHAVEDSRRDLLFTSRES